MGDLSAFALQARLIKADILLVDVREWSEYHAEHISGAWHMPLAELQMEALPAAIDIVFQCKSGYRSAMARQQWLLWQPSRQVYSLTGGLMAWKQAGLPTQGPSV